MTQQPHATQPPTGGGQQPTGAQQQPTWDDTRQGMTPGRADYAPMPPESGWATGGVVFIGVLLLMNGVLAIFQGISALAEDDVWANIGDYVYKINLTGWGVILLVLGAVAVVMRRGHPQGRRLGPYDRHLPGVPEHDRPVPVPAVRAGLVPHHGRRQLLRDLGAGGVPAGGRPELNRHRPSTYGARDCPTGHT